jgi:hypothetical protein
LRHDGGSLALRLGPQAVECALDFVTGCGLFRRQLLPLGAFISLALGQGLGIKAAARGFLGFPLRFFGRAFGRDELVAQPGDLFGQFRL